MKITRRTALGAMATALLPGTLRADDLEPNYLRPLLEANTLPEVVHRLPLQPRVINMAALGREPGRHGGKVRMVVGGQKDIRLMTIFGYSRLVGYDENLNLQADILESYTSEDDRVFTFKIREGHKWSDGTPITTEDFRYAWEDVIGNEDLTPGGIPRVLTSGGKPPVFEIVDDLTVRYTWELPNPDFLPSLAAPQPLYMVMPAFYLRQFHEKYQDPDKLKALMKKNKAKKWTSLHIKMARQYRPENPELPTLDPWRNTTEPPADQFVFERNPYFHRVDENGRQLPYVDQFVLNIASSAIIPAKVGAGESDLQATGIDFIDYAFLKESESRYPVRVSLWKRTQGSRVALLPNLNAADPVWRKLLLDVRVRRALSLAIDRHEINMAVFYGLGREAPDTVLPESVLFKEEYGTQWARHDVDLANKLLDEAGLSTRDDDGIRLLSDGRLAQIVVESSGESTLETDVLELVSDHWREIGISTFIRTSQRDVFRSRAVAGEIMMSIWSGLDNGVPTADMNPGQIAPSSDDQLQWPAWGLSYLSAGEMGAPPDLPEAIKLVELLNRWRQTGNRAERQAIWAEMLTIFTDNVFTIGMVNSTLQPILSAIKLRNIPEKGLFGFDPTSYLGVYMPDAFWLDEA
jgi:peptide/nickel transport system substrate-binding protein